MSHSAKVNSLNNFHLACSVENSLLSFFPNFMKIKIFFRSSSPEPNDFEENAQCSWDHSMDKNGVHTLQVEQRSELGISGSIDSLDLDSQASNYFNQKY